MEVNCDIDAYFILEAGALVTLIPLWTKSVLETGCLVATVAVCFIE